VHVFLAGQAHRGGVDDGHHLLQVIGDDPVVQGLVAVLEGGEEDVFFQVVGFAPVIAHDPHHLLRHGVDARRQQPPQAQGVALLAGEGGALVEGRIVEIVEVDGDAGGFGPGCLVT